MKRRELFAAAAGLAIAPAPKVIEIPGVGPTPPELRLREMREEVRRMAAAMPITATITLKVRR